MLFQRTGKLTGMTLVSCCTILFHLKCQRSLLAQNCIQEWKSRKALNENDTVLFVILYVYNIKLFYSIYQSFWQKRSLTVHIQT